MPRVLYDGWSLVYAPNSPAALHLLALLANLPPDIVAEVALPGPPVWLPADIQTQVQAAPDTPRARLSWEQKTLPQEAKRRGVDLLHLVTATPSLFGRVQTVISPAGFAAPANTAGRRGFFERLRESTSGSSPAQVSALLWPEDLPVDETSQAQFVGKEVPVFRLPPLVYPGLISTGWNPPPQEELVLPESFVLYHGPDQLQVLRRLLDVWSWPAGSLGEGYPLLLLGLGENARISLPAVLEEYGLKAQVHLLPVLSPGSVAQVYRRCTALLHPAPTSPWGDPVRAALACGKPVVAAEGLLPEGDSRSFGAALITTLVEESMAERLSKAAAERAAAWTTGAFGARLLEAYERLL